MIWDGAILSDMGMVTSTGSVSGQSQINIIDASHPMADGHSNGNVTIASSGTKVRWGFPTASADSIAEVAGQPTKSAIFAYQTGDSMNGINAPHRRVGFFIDSTTPVDLNANGWGLFDAAVDWAINGGSSTLMPDPNQATAAAGAFKGNLLGKRGASAKIQAISGSIQRISLSFAGGPVAVQVSGDPDPANNGLFHIYADHLGSTGAMSDSSGVYIPDSHAKYTPFGDWRTEPTATAGDRYYTNHKHNNLGNGADDLGLIYMNARFYLPGVGRFASADTIVPDPANPQAYNRYSYVNNNPLGYSDPSGHVAEEAENGSNYCPIEECWAGWEISENELWLLDMNDVWELVMKKYYDGIWDTINDVLIGPAGYSNETYGKIIDFLGKDSSFIDGIGKSLDAFGKTLGGIDALVRLMAIDKAYSKDDFHSQIGRDFGITMGIRELNYLTFRVAAGFGTGIGLDIVGGVSGPTGWISSAGLTAHDFASTFQENGKGFDESLGRLATDLAFDKVLLGIQFDHTGYSQPSNTIPNYITRFIMGRHPK